MKLSVLPVSYFKEIVEGRMSMVDWAREGVTLGLDAVDISIVMLREKSIAELEKIRGEIESEGIVVGGSSTYPDFTQPDTDLREKEVQQFRRDLELLSALGTQVVRVTSGQAHPGMNRTDGVKRALDGLLGHADRAAELGLQFVFENHGKPGVWDYYDFDYPTDIFLEIAEGLKGSPVRIQFDTANPVAYGDDPLPILKEVYDRVSVIHIADTSTSGSLTPSVIGTGLVEFDGIFDYLKGREYTEWLTIEEASFTGAAGIKTAVDFVKEKWGAGIPAV